MMNQSRVNNLYKPDPRLGLRKSINELVKPEDELNVKKPVVQHSVLDTPEHVDYFDNLRKEIRNQIITHARNIQKADKKKKRSIHRG